MDLCTHTSSAVHISKTGGGGGTYIFVFTDLKNYRFQNSKEINRAKYVYIICIPPPPPPPIVDLRTALCTNSKAATREAGMANAISALYLSPLKMLSRVWYCMWRFM